MDIIHKEISPHPDFLDVLFRYKSQVLNIFREVLGLLEIHHLSITCIHKNQLLTFSSTPALEFNLFTSNLWRFDKSYHPAWYQRCTQSTWPLLYTKQRYDELFYLKQAKYKYALGVSLGALYFQLPMIFSLASHKSDVKTQQIFETEYETFYKISQYCTGSLLALFEQSFLCAEFDYFSKASHELPI